MDNFCEQIIKKERTGGDTAKYVIIIVLMVLVIGVCIFFSLQGLYILLMLAFSAGWGGVWLLKGISVEYEYIITNNEMDIDKITGRRKRTRMITVDLSKAEDFYTFSEQNVKFDTTVYASSGLETDAYCLIVLHSDYGKVRIIFNPDERTREAIVQEFPFTLRTRMNNDAK